jgi:hypothetical protein
MYNYTYNTDLLAAPKPLLYCTYCNKCSLSGGSYATERDTPQ